MKPTHTHTITRTQEYADTRDFKADRRVVYFLLPYHLFLLLRHPRLPKYFSERFPHNITKYCIDLSKNFEEALLRIVRKQEAKFEAVWNF